MSIQSTGGAAPGRIYTLQTADSGMLTVSDRRATEAAQIDTNGDGVCADPEIEAWLRARREIKAAPADVDVPAIIEEFKSHLLDQVRATAAEGYRSLDEMTSQMRQIADAHPHLVQMSSIAKTAEGRDVWALKITSSAQTDTTYKPGVVITGTHHAREWMTPEVTLQLALDMAASYEADPETRRRLDGAELWFVPVVNPDGFEYSRSEDSWWRKNRTPVTDAAGQVQAHGVDLNRNYWDGNPDHMILFRADGDTPESTWDDFGASDDPSDDTYRGQPASEPEVQGLMALEYGRPNIRGILDHHSYGQELLRPWGHIEEPPDTLAEYDQVGPRMQAAQGPSPYRYHQSVESYPTLGSSETCHEANGKFNFTIEMGRSFQPQYNTFPDLYKKVSAADLAFIDWISEKFPATPPTPPPTDPPVPPTDPPVPPTDPPDPPTDPPAPPTDPPAPPPTCPHPPHPPGQQP